MLLMFPHSYQSLVCVQYGSLAGQQRGLGLKSSQYIWGVMGNFVARANFRAIKGIVHGKGLYLMVLEMAEVWHERYIWKMQNVSQELEPEFRSLFLQQ